MDVRTLTVGMIVKGNGKIIVSGSTGDCFSRVIGQGSISMQTTSMQTEAKKSQMFPAIDKGAVIVQ
jgi:hypothetical protein